MGSKFKEHVFLSVMTDSATDVGVCEVEDMCVHFLKDGQAFNAFVGLKSSSNAKAPHITEAVNSVMTGVCENWKEKAVALGSDGASVMVGDMGGVYTLLKIDAPHLIKVQCIAQ